MPTVSQLHFDIQKGIQGLPAQSLEEVKLFIDFLRVREATVVSLDAVDMDQELRQLDTVEAQHLEEEIMDYKDIYPREG